MTPKQHDRVLELHALDRYKTDYPSRLVLNMYMAGFGDGRDEGYADGRGDGYEAGYADGRKEGYADGRKEGYDQGLREGFEAGYNEPPKALNTSGM